ncbi:O-antigen ligase family protein [Candidatus Marinimicrobia bacterium]|nr:O-antigen ligase family protein [Candidatus Neomarinimicrobiota bacterium]
MLTQPSTQLIQVNFEQVYLVTPVVIFLCINFRYLQDYVSNVIFFLGSIYAIFGIMTYYYLSNTNQLFLFSSNIFALFDLDFDVHIYQNVGFWISLFAICLFNVILTYTKSFKNNRFIMLCLIFSFLVSTYILLIVGARGAFVGLILALIYLTRNIRDEKFIYASVFGIVVLAFFILLNQESFLTINRLFSIFNGYDQSSRIFLFSQAIQLWTHDINTILFGGGVKSFPIFINQNNFGVYPHNIFLEILSELGVVGLIIFLKILFIFYKNRGKNELINAFSIFTVFIFCVTGSLDSFYQAFFFLCLGLKKISNDI